MNRHCYLDTCFLVDWALSIPGGTAADVKNAADWLERLVGPDRNSHQLAVSELTFLEFRDVCGRYEVRSEPEHAKYDAEWMKGAEQRLWSWIASGELLVLDPVLRLPELVTQVIGHVTEVERRQMRAFDAAHLIAASQWSLEISQRVSLITSDHKFASVVDGLAGFTPHVEMTDLRVVPFTNA
jgi:hypothetical protein